MRGHPVHPALVHFPLGLLLSATVADLGDYLDPDNDTRFDHLPLEHFGDPAHRTDCSHRD